MVTVDEYNKILQSVYDKGYVLVDIADVWSEVTGEDGQPKMVKNTLYLPEGKKPLILSYDDTNYYDYMLANGFAYKLIIGEDGKIASWGLDPRGMRWSAGTWTPSPSWTSSWRSTRTSPPSVPRAA